jgi:hypothetical protein
MRPIWDGLPWRRPSSRYRTFSHATARPLTARDYPLEALHHRGQLGAGAGPAASDRDLPRRAVYSVYRVVAASGFPRHGGEVMRTGRLVREGCMRLALDQLMERCPVRTCRVAVLPN